MTSTTDQNDEPTNPIVPDISMNSHIPSLPSPSPPSPPSSPHRPVRSQRPPNPPNNGIIARMWNFANSWGVLVTTGFFTGLIKNLPFEKTMTSPLMTVLTASIYALFYAIGTGLVGSFLPRNLRIVLTVILGYSLFHGLTN